MAYIKVVLYCLLTYIPTYLLTYLRHDFKSKEREGLKGILRKVPSPLHCLTKCESTLIYLIRLLSYYLDTYLGTYLNQP